MPGSLSINRPRGLSKGPTKISKSVLPASQDRGTWGRLIFKAFFYAYGLNGPPLTNCAKHGYTGGLDSIIHSACERACCAISTNTLRVSVGLRPPRKKAMRTPRIPSWTLKRR
jgi:hypothetical protein